MLKLGRHKEAAESYDQSRSVLSAPGRAGNQPAVAMVIYKQGCAAYEGSNYSEAAYVLLDTKIASGPLCAD